MTAAPKAVRISAVLALVLSAVWLFWPLALGGGTTFLATHGNSMEPRFQAGDLAILRVADGYAVGDVVAYRSGSLDTVVMHRIVSGDAAGFVTQGDNNDWLDQDEPSQEEILGRLFVRVPQGGKVMDTMGSPGVLIPAAGAALTVLGSASAPRSRRRGRSGRSSGHRAPVFSMSTRARARQVALGSAAVVLLAAAACCALLVVPATQTETRTVEVTQQGQFAYTGRAVPGTTYPTGVIATGDTVWTRLSKDLTVSFTDTITGPQLTGVTGDLRLDVVVAAADGWSAVLDSGPVARFENGAATAAVQIDPAAAAELVGRHYAEIGVPGSPATLTVTPVAETTGTVEDHAFSAPAPDALSFTLEEMSLRPAGDLAAVLTPSTKTEVLIEEVVPRSFGVLAVTVPFDVAQQLAGGLLLAALMVLGAGAWIGRTGRGDVADQFLVRHADRILPVEAINPGPSVVDVSDAESLHRVAERFDTVVLHHAGPDGDTFAVRDLDLTYRFVVPGMPGRPRGKPPVPPVLDPAAEPEPVGLWSRVA